MDSEEYDLLILYIQSQELEIQSIYSYFHLSENKTINVFPIDYIVQLSKLTSHCANKYLTLRFNK